MFGYKMRTTYMNLAIFHLKIFPHFWQPKPSKKTFFYFFIFNFAFWRYIASEKKEWAVFLSTTTKEQKS